MFLKVNLTNFKTFTLYSFNADATKKTLIAKLFEEIERKTATHRKSKNKVDRADKTRVKGKKARKRYELLGRRDDA